MLSIWKRAAITAAVITGAVSLTAPGDAEAKLTRLSIASRQPFVGGATFGTVGAYERLLGTATFEIDPNDPLHAQIVDLPLAPRNAQGKVEWTSQFLIIKPVDPSRGNRKLIYGPLNNRGTSALTVSATPADVNSTSAYLLRQGYTVIDIGWQGNLLPATGKLAPNYPIATNANGTPITQRIRVPFNQRGIPAGGAFTQNLEGNGGAGSYRPYETADINTANATFTVRDGVNGTPTTIASNRWAYGRCPTGQGSLVAGTFDICYFDGFQQDKLYELFYTAKNPTVLGLTYPTVRDFASFLRYETVDAAGTPNPVGPIVRVYGHGVSQVGSLYRELIYLGFNEDEQHRKVHDGVFVAIAGTLRLFTNVRFADPNLYTEQDDIPDFLQNSFPPFTYAVTRDPISGVTDGLMKRPAMDPLVVQIDSETEFYQLHGSLNVVDGAGNPLTVPSNVRLYFSNNTPHGYQTGGLIGTVSGTAAVCRYATPGTVVGDTTRVAYAILDDWVDRGIAPPNSNYPRIENGTLGTLAQAAARFPAIPNVRFPTVINELRQLNYGPQFTLIGGVQTIVPPVMGAAYAQFVPLSNSDGTNLAGIQPLNVRVPIGTGTGWNATRFPGPRETDLCGLTGSFFPLARTREERQATGDPRPSLTERYFNDGGYYTAVTVAVQNMVRERFLLQEDADAYLQAASTSTFVGTEPAPGSNGGGGCSLVGPQDSVDPTLLGLAAAAVFGIGMRRRRAASKEGRTD